MMYRRREGRSQRCSHRTQLGPGVSVREEACVSVCEGCFFTAYIDSRRRAAGPEGRIWLLLQLRRRVRWVYPGLHCYSSSPLQTSGPVGRINLWWMRKKNRKDLMALLQFYSLCCAWTLSLFDIFPNEVMWHMCRHANVRPFNDLDVSLWNRELPSERQLCVPSMTRGQRSEWADLQETLERHW